MGELYRSGMAAIVIEMIAAAPPSATLRTCMLGRVKGYYESGSRTATQDTPRQRRARTHLVVFGSGWLLSRVASYYPARMRSRDE